MVQLSLVSHALHAQCPTLIWSDEFEGESLDMNNWSLQVGDGCPDLCGWGNNELQYYQENNLTVSNGTLKIEARKETVETKQYTSARIRSIDLAEFTFGRMEARIKLPRGQGLWPAFWMLSSAEPYGTWAASGEIDIMELIGSEPNVVHGTIHYGGTFPNNKSKGTAYTLASADFSDDFHEFAIEWTSSGIQWFVDGYAYAEIKSAQVIPSRWPFDHDFHFLLNLAVGGNWPGAPDGTTQFPQVMEVDYVRVYDTGQKPFVTGPNSVQAFDTATYALENPPNDAIIMWQIPEGATIVTGAENEEEISIAWGETSGQVAVNIQSECFTQEFEIDVSVEPPPPSLALERALENFDDPGLVEFSSSTGELSEVNNPSPSDLNNSALCGAYIRNATEQFDVLFYSTQAIANASDYIAGEKKFYIDVLTDAAPGTEIILQLENGGRAQQNFPTGRNSRFNCKTTLQNEWERLEFSFVDRPDPFTGNSTIDQIVLLFASNSTTGNTYYFDNLAIYAPEQSVANKYSTGLGSIKIYPNPADSQFMVDIEDPARVQSISCYNIGGEQVDTVEVKGRNNIPFSTNQWVNGIYFVVIEGIAGESLTQKIKISQN